MSNASIGTLGFMIYLAVTLAESNDRADLLKDIRDNRYPAQEKLRGAHHGLEHIDSRIEQAFATSNSKLLDHTMVLAGEFRQNLDSAIDMDVRLSLSGSNEMTELAYWFNTFIEKLQRVTIESTAEIARLAYTDTLTNLHLLKKIEIEITETSAIDNIEVVENNILELKQRGIKIAMDDFGAGHSSLTLLTRCPIDTLKIDKEITQQIAIDARSQTIVQSMIDLATRLEVSVCAEGIESKAQMMQLQAMNCKFGQGYYFSEPLSAAQLTAFIQTQHNNADRAA